MSADDLAFRMNGARSKGLVVGLSAAILVESLALHALLYRRWPLASLAILVTNVWAIWWLASHYRAVGRTPTLVQPTGVLVRYGRQVSASVPYSAIREVRRATWKDVPTSSGDGYLKLAGTDDPNVIMHLEPPARIRLAFGGSRAVSRLAIRLDEPERFVETVRGRCSGSNT